MTLEGKVAFVTGASRGIGRATALLLAEQGADVAVNFRNSADDAADVEEAIRALGRNAVAVKADVRDLEEVKTAVDTAVKMLGGVDILINNAGLARDNLAAFMKDEEWTEVIDTNLKGAFHLIKVLSRPMAAKRWGRIVNVSSDAGLMGDMMRANYSASKAGLIGLTKAMARELAGSRITVNAVAPGYVETDMTANAPEKKSKRLERVPMRRFGTPREVAEVIAFLVSEDGAYITGQVLCIDGGMRM